MGKRFDSDEATVVSCATYAPCSAAGNWPPQVHFTATDHVMTAEPPGARIRCELEQPDASRVTIRTTAGEHIAAVTVHIPPGEMPTEETIAIASALYWSWWRARDLRGEAPKP